MHNLSFSRRALALQELVTDIFLLKNSATPTHSPPLAPSLNYSTYSQFSTFWIFYRKSRKNSSKGLALGFPSEWVPKHPSSPVTVSFLLGLDYCSIRDRLRRLCGEGEWCFCIGGADTSTKKPTLVLRPRSLAYTWQRGRRRNVFICSSTERTKMYAAYPLSYRGINLKQTAKGDCSWRLT
jgi:hypothetical protein